MRQTFIVAIFAIFSILSVSSCLPPKKEKVAQADTLKTEIDSALVVELGADDYGMKNYVMALLKKGPKRWKMDSTTVSTLMKGHMDNIGRLANEGKLVLAGPYTDETDLKGIYVFDVKTIEEAQKLCETDPAIVAGALAIELHPWYGSAALMQTNAIHKKIARKSY